MKVSSQLYTFLREVVDSETREDDNDDDNNDDDDNDDDNSFRLRLKLYWKCQGTQFFFYIVSFHIKLVIYVFFYDTIHE